jgi:hypothetical protein
MRPDLLEPSEKRCADAEKALAAVIEARGASWTVAKRREVRATGRATARDDNAVT